MVIPSWFVLTDDGSLVGCVKLSFPDPVNASYKRYFVKMAQSDIPLQDVPTNPELLPVPLSRTFKILVEHVSLLWLGLAW
jgi:hypothetical protein